ncbi:hypothetical protein PAXRUDRAFT_28940 [Paxillus rubicundulus Ve08.2h10]|uniref:Uncharacterized protein n=1 Tax=Paxillus rubicundulus Ve08.2h10 TaxID=930991 RepID=A0A0D0BZY6_9AGAM|nr:hypothetical protein PAXRUDRAFT_28940 [Paxillus rubicundulus Ve08.2h10]
MFGGFGTERKGRGKHCPAGNDGDGKLWFRKNRWQPEPFPSIPQVAENLPPGPCLGLPFHWHISKGMNMQTNIPWSRTLTGGPDELPFVINLIDSQSYAHSQDCARVTQFDGSCCPSCAGLNPKVSELRTMITMYKPRTRRSLLNITQLHQALDNRNAKLNKRKFKCNAPWLQHILHTLLKNGASIQTILRRIEDAVVNGYNPHSYNQAEFNLALLIYRVGGANLLTTLNQRLCIPAVHTVQNNTLSIKITPTISSITSETTAQNIHSVIIEPHAQSGQTALRGVSLLMDETALEEAATYHPAQNGVRGLCWKHAGVIYPYLDTYDSAEQLAQNIQERSSWEGDDQTYPVLAAPSCKEEDHTDWEALMYNIIELWYDNDTHKKVGPLWSFATDGNATHHKAGHKIFLQAKLIPSSPIYGILSGLAGLNLRRVNSKILLHYLCWLNGCDKERAHKLLFPNDPQDVPHAVELICAVVQLGQINTTKPLYTRPGQIPDIDAIIDIEAISLLGTILQNLLEPFVNPSLSLTEQICHLSTAAHLLVSFYRIHRTAFLPNPLMYDTMAMIKNIIFCAAKQLRLDAGASFFLPDVGTDAIKTLFAYVPVSTTSKPTGYVLHETSVEYTQDMWKGNIFVRNCNLQATWFNGHKNVVSILSTSPLHPEDYAYEDIFSVEGVDMLCVFGGGKYLGINQEDDREDTSMILSDPTLYLAGPVVVEHATQAGLVPEGEGNPIEQEVFGLTFKDQLEDKLGDSSNLGISKAPSPLFDGTSLLPPSGKGVRPADYLFCKGKWVHKASVCRLLFNEGFTAKSHDQLLQSSFVISNPFVTLLCHDGHTTALALVHSTSIQENGVSCDDINLKTLQVNGSKVKVMGNVLTLLPACTCEPADPDGQSKPAWVWNGAYLKTDSSTPGRKGMMTEKVIEVCTLGSLIEPVNPSIVEALAYLPTEQTAEINS